MPLIQKQHFLYGFLEKFSVNHYFKSSTYFSQLEIKVDLKGASIDSTVYLRPNNFSKICVAFLSSGIYI